MTAELINRERYSYRKRRQVAIAAVCAIACVIVLAAGLPVTRAANKNGKEIYEAVLSGNIDFEGAEKAAGKAARGRSLSEEEMMTMGKAYFYAQFKASDFSSMPSNFKRMIEDVLNGKGADGMVAVSELQRDYEEAYARLKLTVGTDTAFVEDLRDMFKSVNKNGLSSTTSVAKIKSVKNDYGDSGFLIDSVFSPDDFVESDFISIYNNNMHSIFDTVKGILGSGFYEAIVGNSSDPQGTAAFSAGNVVLNAVKWFGIALALIYAVVHAFQIFARGETNLDTGIKVAVCMVLSFVAVIYVDDILGAADNLGNYVVEVTRESIETAADNAFEEAMKQQEEEAAIQEQVNAEMDTSVDVLQSIGNAFSTAVAFIQDIGENILAGIKSLIASIVYALMNLLTTYGIAVACFGLYMSFCLRRAFMPIALANVMSEGARSSGWRYIKRYFAMYLEFGYFYIIAAVATMMCNYAQTNALAANSSNTVMGVAGAVICIKMATSAALRKSGELAREVVGD